MNKITRGALSAAALLILAGGFIVAQVSSPAPPATGSPVVGTLVATDPTFGAACASYNTFAYNYTTGAITPCVLGVNGATRVRTGVSANTDLAGSVTLSAGAGSYTFTGTYALAPVCVATDSTAAAAVKASATTTVLTLAGTTTDVLKYVCVVRN